MTDEPKPTLADILTGEQPNALAPDSGLSRILERLGGVGQRASRPFLGETQFKDSPAAHELLRLLGLMGMVAPGRSPRGHAIMRDNMLARSLEKAAPPSDPGLTGGSPGYAFHDQWGPYGVPSNRHSSTGMSYYDWHGMRNAKTGEPLPNPWPNYRGHVDPIEAMTRDTTGRIERGDLGAAQTPYDQAVAQQSARQELLQILEGGRRRPPTPANDLE